MATFPLTQSKPVTNNITADRLFWAGALTAVLAVATNLVIFFWAETRIDLSGFPLLNPVSVIASNAVAAVLATIIYGLLGRYAARPTDTFRTITTAGLFLSLLPIVGLLFGMIPGVVVTAGTVVTLALMHTLAAAMIFSMLTTLAHYR